jgi:hypothetical protein
MSHRSRKCPGSAGTRRTRRALQDRRVDVQIDTAALLAHHAACYRRSIESALLVGGPVTHLTPEEYYAEKMTGICEGILLNGGRDV